MENKRKSKGENALGIPRRCPPGHPRATPVSVSISVAAPIAPIVVIPSVAGAVSAIPVVIGWYGWRWRATELLGGALRLRGICRGRRVGDVVRRGPSIPGAPVTATVTAGGRGTSSGSGPSADPATVALGLEAGLLGSSDRGLGLAGAAAAAARADAAAEDREEDEAADDGGDGDDDLQVVADKVESAPVPLGAFTIAITALPAPVARRAVQEVLLHVVAGLRAQLRRTARHDAAPTLRVAR